MNAKTKILNFLLQNVGQIVKTAQLREVAGVSEYARRLRELREEGWAIITFRDDTSLKPDEYKLLNSIRGPARNRKASRKIWLEVLNRNGFTCQNCGRTKGDPDPTIPGRKVILNVDHINPEGPDEPENLRVLCSACNEGRSDIEQAPSRETLRALAIIRRSPRKIQEEVYRFLKRKFEGNCPK